jgi:hypothetical protein
VNFSVINRCPQASLRVLWLDFDGQEREYRVLGPGQEAQFITYPNHSWLFRHAQSNRLVGNLIAPASSFMATLP